LPPPPAFFDSETLAPTGLTAAAGTTVAVPGYDIVRELGRGGMGVVYLARQTKLNRPVALKMILAGSHAGAADLARFQTEAEAIARLQHPNIVQVYEVGEHEGKPFFSLEFCGGGNLEKKLNGTPLPPNEAAALVEVLSRAMQAAHERGVIHRDLKPANVLLAEDGTPKVTDFGLAKKIGEAGQTQTGAVMGTPSYMAPEQADGRGRETGPACDVYALGAILFECLTGRPPFKGPTPLDTMMQVVADEPVPPSRLNSKVPRDLETVCLKCLRKSPDQRYGSAAILADDLRRFRAGEPIAARPVGRWERAVKWARRRPTAAALLLVVALAGAGLLTAMTVSYLLISRALDDRTAALGEKTEALGEKTQALTDLREEKRKTDEALRREIETAYVQRVGRAAVADDSATADRLLDECPADLRGWEWHYLRHLWHADLVTLRGHVAPVLAVAFADDGRRIISAEGIGAPLLATRKRGPADPSPGAARVRTWDAITGRPVAQADPQVSQVTAAAFTPDGGLAVVHGVRTDKEVSGEIKVLNLRTRQSQTLAQGPQVAETSAVAISPDGRQAARATVGGILVCDAVTGQVSRTLGAPHVPVVGLAFSPDGALLAAAGVGAGVRVWDLKTGEKVLSLSDESEDALAVAFSPDGRSLATGGADRRVRLWDARSGAAGAVCAGHTAAVTALLFSPDGRVLASATGNAWFTSTSGAVEVRLWDAATGDELHALRGHGGGVNGLAFSPDGRRLACASDDGTVRVWATDRDPEALVFRAGPSGLTDLAVSTDGRRVAVARGGDLHEVVNRTVRRVGGIKLWDAATGKELPPLRGVRGRVVMVGFSARGERFVTMSLNGLAEWTLDVWDGRTGKRTALPAGDAGLLLPAVSPDGKRLATGGARDVTFWDADTGEALGRLPVPNILPPQILFSPDGRLTAVPGKGALTVWDTGTCREAASCEDSAGAVAMSFSPDGRHLAAADAKGIRLWNASTGKAEHTWPERPALNFRDLITFSPDSKSLAVAGKDNVIRVWDVAGGTEVAAFRGHTGLVRKLAVSPDGKQAASWGRDGKVRVWQTADGKELRAFPVDGQLDTVYFSPDFQHFLVSKEILKGNEPGEVVVRALADGRELRRFGVTPADPQGDLTLVSAGADGRLFAAVTAPAPLDVSGLATAAVWDAERGTELAAFPAATDHAPFALSPDGQRIAVAVGGPAPRQQKRDWQIEIWGVAGKQKVLTIPAQPAEVRVLAFDPNGRRVAAGAKDGTVKVWAADTGQEVVSLRAHDKPVARLKFSPDDRRLASLGEEGTLKMWDAASGAAGRAIEGASSDLAFSPDGTRLAAPAGDNLARVWDAATGEVVLTLTGHGAAVNRVAFSPDGGRVLTGSADRTVKVWDAKTGRELFTLRGHADAITGLAFDRDGRHLATSDLGGTVRVWDATPLTSVGD
jgi:WD40 repeat protein